MWSITDPKTGLTNRVTVPSDGIVTVIKPEGVDVHTYVNDIKSGIHHLHAKAGDVVHFKMVNSLDSDADVTVEFGGMVSNLKLAASAAAIEGRNMMTEAVNLFTNPGNNMTGALGGGLGAGLLGGVLGGVLLNNNGVLGNNRSGVAATPTDVQIAVSDSAILTALGDIKASVPLAEAQVQLALAGVQNGLTSAITTGNLALSNSLGQVENVLLNQINTQNLATQKSFSDVASLVTANGTANLLATERSAYAVTQAVNADGDKTRALIQSIDKTNDSRLITSLANEVAELKNDNRIASATGNITISNNNAATANAQQQQAQQQFQILANLNAQIQALASDIQTVKQSSVVFNSGSMRESGNQSAANTRVA